jgi:hypothetical protein
MKTQIKTNKIKRLLCGAALSVLAGPALLAQSITPPPPTTPPPPVAPPPTVVTPSASITLATPAVSVQVGVPESYTWDGDEYVGLVGNGYYYLGPGNVWLPLDQHRLDRFRLWEHDHGDWRHHAIVNERYRNDAHGHFYPLPDRNLDHGGR